MKVGVSGSDSAYPATGFRSSFSVRSDESGVVKDPLKLIL
jgi:hypothetical protein